MLPNGGMGRGGGAGRLLESACPLENAHHAAHPAEPLEHLERTQIANVFFTT